MTAASTIVRDLRAEIDSVSAQMAELNHANMASERASHVGRLADLKHQLEIAETRVQFDGKTTVEVEKELTEAGSELESIPAKIKELGVGKDTKYRRRQLEQRQAELAEVVKALQIESVTRADEARLEHGLSAIATHAAEAAR
jgi:hypothetical protein